jgi:pilus assembly protein Flp/PilA
VDSGVRVRQFRALFRDHRGATAIEYGLILALIFLAIIGAVHSVADHVIATWGSVNTQVANATK